ncbi:unnamed protein product [Rotaria sordida]|uniref:Uncharacterized protein n=1 Tax=Rotaria sordida TaxID=392033 RepID=A0A815IUY4_9BILA|nr:unnamed protein product [Rotaria sordida]CAF1371430.1 unnamed protein product [Rotaria sordida]
MSVAINDVRQIVAIGLPIFDIVMLLNITVSGDDGWLNLTRTINSSQVNVGFGRSLAWIDDKTIAIAVLDVADQSWSRSEVWIFNMDIGFKRPLFAFPNQQQILNMPKPPLFLHIISSSRGLLILTDQRNALLLLSSPAGFHPVLYDNIDALISVSFYEFCPAGTFKNNSGIGPCTVCPPQTKNPGDQPCIECTPCLPTSFCPMASVDDTVTNVSYPSYTQTFSYPDTPDTDNYDDLLIQNMFSVGKTTRCLIISPMFWTLLVIGICLLICFMMILIKLRRCRTVSRHRTLAKNLFKAADIINDGERWIGGLISLSIFVLFGFAFRFAAEYVKLYPIETSTDADISCDRTLRNALFDNALQLLLPNPDGNRWPIFGMLDEQRINMTLDLVNTRADCSDMTFQQNRIGVNYLSLSLANCILQPDNITRSVSIELPTHRISVQLNITGPYFIGGFRLCLRGPGQINDAYELKALNICQFFSTPNQTLSSVTTLSVVLIKIINQTKPLHVSDTSKYDGRWVPTFAENSLSDEMIYEQYGDYLRYSRSRHILAITFSEQPFFVQNNQKSIVRLAELAFHTLLFCTLVIELFAIAFLLFKLISKPTIHLVNLCKKRSKNQLSEILPIPTKNYANRNNSARKKSHRLTSLDRLRLVRDLKRRQRKQPNLKSSNETFRVSPELTSIEIERNYF